MPKIIKYQWGGNTLFNNPLFANLPFANMVGPIGNSSDGKANPLAGIQSFLGFTPSSNSVAAVLETQGAGGTSGNLVSQDLGIVQAAVPELASLAGGGIGSIINAGKNFKSLAGAMKDAKAAGEGLKGLRTNIAGNAIGMVGNVLGMASSFIPGLEDLYAGPKGDITLAVDSVYDNVSNTLMAILDSNFLKLTPFGLINTLGAKKTTTLTKDNEAFEQVGSSYGGTSYAVDDALKKAGKKYGLFSSKERREADSEISEARRQQMLMAAIADNAADRFAITDSMAAINNNRRALALQGGYNQAAVRVGKSGMSLDLIAKAKKVLHESRKLKGGGLITPTEILLVVPEFQDGGLINKKSRTLQELIEYAKKENPRFILRMSEPLKYIDLGNGDYATHLMGYEFDPDTLKWYVYSQVLEDDNGNLKLYDFPEAFNRALEKKNVLEMTLDEAKLFTESEELSDGTFKGYKAGWPDFFKLKPGKFLLGGSINVIPEGALHARLHHMDMDGITKKGIPVVDNNGVLQAEIEHSEIIFRIEVTKKLEELLKKYYSENYSDKEKNEFALEAGLLLIDEVLHNTDDRTNLINLVE